MTIRFLKAWNGNYEGQIVSGLAGAEETRLIGLGYASADLNGAAENNPIAKFNEARTALVNPDTGADVSFGGGSSTGITAGRTITASTTAILTDAQTLLTFSHATVAGVISINKESVIAWPALCVIEVYQDLAAACTFAAVGGSGVVINGSPTGLLNAIQKVGTDKWVYL